LLLLLLLGLWLRTLLLLLLLGSRLWHVTVS
jgi:hypothetical protein